MGLHLCFELTLPENCPPVDVRDALCRLREKALALPFETVTPLFNLSGDECEAGALSRTAPLEWWFKHTTTGYRDHGDHGVAVNAVAATGFTVAPGRRCEPAAFGLARYSEPVSAHPTPDGPGVDTKGWHWHTCSKTQYASVVSEEHLIRCHGSLVDLLDEAVGLGIGVTVRDETHYWPTRDAGRLVEEVRKMNRIVAKLAGRLGDVLGDDVRVGGAITEHRRFEDLEME